VRHELHTQPLQSGASRRRRQTWASGLEAGRWRVSSIGVRCCLCAMNSAKQRRDLASRAAVATISYAAGA
jgi:hypothetical protein